MTTINYKKQINMQVYKINYILTILLLAAAVFLISNGLAYADVFEDMVSSVEKNSSVGLIEPYSTKVTPTMVVEGLTTNFLIEANRTMAFIDGQKEELRALYEKGGISTTAFNNESRIFAELQTLIREMKGELGNKYDKTKTEARLNAEFKKLTEQGEGIALKKIQESQNMTNQVIGALTEYSEFITGSSKTVDVYRLTAIQNFADAKSRIMSAAVSH